MGKTKYGYTMQKIEEKADKRGLSVEAYLNYLNMRSHNMIVYPVGESK